MYETGAATFIEPMPLPSVPRAVRSVAILPALKPRKAKKSFQATLRHPQFLERSAVSPRGDRFYAIRITVKASAPRRGVARRRILVAAMSASAAQKMRLRQSSVAICVQLIVVRVLKMPLFENLAGLGIRKDLHKGYG